MSTDETPPEGGRDFRAALKARWDTARDAVAARWPDALKGPVALALAGALVVGFGGGFAVGKGGQFFGGGKPAGAEAAKGEAWSLFGKPRSANAPRRGIPKPEGFAVWQTRVDSSGPDPLACIRMSRDLDPSKAYADFVLVSPDLGRQPSVRVKGDELCLGGIGFTDHRITPLKGLPAKGGETLGANADVDFTFGEKPPYVGFAGDGVILPREESDGVAIETINVQTLAIEVWRVPDRNLVRKSISAPEPTGEGDWAGDYGEDSVGDDGRQVWKGAVQVTGGATGQKATTVFPLGAVLKDMKAGAFVIKARDASGGRDAEDGDNNPAQARRWIVFTDMAMLAYDGSESLDVVVRSLKSAKTMSGVRVALVAADGESLAEAQSDADGRVRFLRPLLKGQGAERAKMVMAYGAQGDLAVLDLDRSPVDLSKQGVGGRTEGGVDGRSVAADIDGYLYADRGIYRPGETVHLTAMIRDRMAKAVNDRKDEIIVKRPSGVEFRRYQFSQANAGVALADIALPRSAPRGRWTAELRIEGIEEATGSLSFSVEDFAPQRLAVTATGQESVPLALGDTRKVDVSARFLYGAPGAGLQTQGEARLRADTDPFPAFKGFEWGDQGKPFEEKYLDLGATVTDGEGRAILSVGTGDVGDTAQPLVASVTASVFEPGGRPVREGLELKIRPKAVYYGVKVEQGEAGQGDPPVSLDLIAVNAAGQRIGATATYTLVAERWDYDWFQQNGRWQWRRSSRDAIVAKAQVNIGAGQPARINRRLGWGDYRLEVEGADGARTVTRFSAGWGAPAREGEAPDVVRVTAGTKTYAQGDTVEITLKPPYAGEAQIAVATDRLIDLKTVRVGEKGTTVRLKTSAAWGGGAYVMVSVIQPRDPVASPKPRRALGLVYVPIDPKGRKLTVDLGTPTKIDSKAPVEIPVKVSGMGLGQKARITIAAVDEGILRLTHQESPDPVKWYFGKRALTLNYRDDYGRLLDPNMGAPANVNFGGDEIGGEGLTTTPIKTVALWSGVVETGFDGKAVVKLPAADFNGELRIQAVAWTDTAVGSASKPLTVRQPVVADLNLPRFLAPGD